MKKGNCRKVSRFLRHPFRGKVLWIPFLFTIRKPVSPHFNKLFFDFSRQTISDSRRGSVARLVLNRFRTFFFVLLTFVYCVQTQKVTSWSDVHPRWSWKCNCVFIIFASTVRQCLLSNEMLIQCPSVRSFACLTRFFFFPAKLNSFPI